MGRDADQSQKGSRERVILEDLGCLDGSSEMKDWPPIDFLPRCLLPKYESLLTSKDPDFWQSKARMALLTECGFLDRNHEFEPEVVHQIWNDLVIDSAKKADNKNSNEKGSDLIQFFKDHGRSNQRKLRWALMDCAPACQFQLHAHPNLELVYCVKGELHEIRLEDDDNVITKSFETKGETAPNENQKVIGPSLNQCRRPWKFKTLSQGNWLVNRVGTIHKSFTSTSGAGCVLLTLWGGSHANIIDEPDIVLSAVQEVDRQIGCRCRGESVSIPEVFLPDSEKSGGR